ncbi:uncharacterized protein PADG_06078 [Paracoccidioides brasiliensis Pb18]|uniref:Histone-lysine N-methyltransferase ASH1L n=1 Tax=Paracoccidioides brasiliensis (strain Pb18) TaxID=502780 RepID=C1GFP2_PARBD|nr:uncharacterized protein PADG_06078 [Paracoccidioides brasiliensis Pb18]EEH49999.2 hypothetical protein PADG_06078 [Paracoccidioides brasiliensis Pb18]
MARSSQSSAVAPSSSSTPSSRPGSDTGLTTEISADEHLLTPPTSQSETSSRSGGAMDVEEKDGEEVVSEETISQRVTRSSLANEENNMVSEEMASKVDDAKEVAFHPLRSNPPEVDGGLPTSEGARANIEMEHQLDKNEEGKNARGAKKRHKSESGSRRRSSRLALLGKISEVVSKVSTVLGKRAREDVMKEKDKLEIINRRASLRSRNVAQEERVPSTTSTAVATADGPVTKKRRVSKGDAVVLNKKASAASTTVKEQKLATVTYKRKKWLSHGLYAGQDRYFDPRLTEEKNRIKFGKKNEEERNKLFPLPMFAGERLIKDGRDFKLPFDIFSPLPPGQPKPDEWRKTNKNVFVGDAASIWKANKLGECSTCMCTPESGCDENCQNRCMFYECDDDNCKLGAELCRNRSFEDLRQRIKAGGKYNIGVEVIKTADRGYGVRSNRTFAPNQIIVEYTGEIITQKECERRMRTVYKNNECYYLMYFDQNMIIDATRGSIARFVNHSCEPNCEMEKWTVAGKPRMALFAGKNGITTGEELTYDYNFDPYSQKNVQECRCGAETCRGVLGPKSKDSNKSRSVKQGNTKQSSKDAKKKAVSSKSGQALIGKKRKQETALDESSTSRLNKRRRVLKQTSKAFNAGIKKAVAGARLAANSSTKAKVRGKAKAKAKINAATAVKAKPAPVKKTKDNSRSKTTTKSTNARWGGRKSKIQAETGTSVRKQRDRTKLNRPSKKLNSIAVSRTTSRTPAIMRRFLEAGKLATEYEIDGTLTVDKPGSKRVVAKRRYTNNNASKQSKIKGTVTGVAGKVKRGRSSV